VPVAAAAVVGEERNEKMEAIAEATGAMEGRVVEAAADTREWSPRDS